jgi:protein-disulfide isomerase
MMLRRAVLVLIAICLGCSAQAPPSAKPAATSSQASSAPATASGQTLTGDLAQTVERQVRSHYALPPDVKVVLGSLRASEFPNYDALTITFDNSEKKQTYEFLLSHDQKTLLRMTKLDLSKDPYAEIMKKIDVKGRPTRGNKDAKVVVVNYDDFECPFCSRMHSTLFPEILKEYGDRVLIIYKDYPLEEIHPWSVHAAVDANCLNAQNGDAYWDYADYLHANQHAVTGVNGKAGQSETLDKLAMEQGQEHNLDMTKLQACVKAQDDKAVRASMDEGDAVGVNATPTLFVNGQKLDGAVPVEQVRETLDRALTDAGVAPPEHKAGAGNSKTPAPPSK